MVSFWGTLNIRGRIIIGTQKGTIILTTTHISLSITIGIHSSFHLNICKVETGRALGDSTIVSMLFSVIPIYYPFYPNNGESNGTWKRKWKMRLKPKVAFCATASGTSSGTAFQGQGTSRESKTGGWGLRLPRSRTNLGCKRDGMRTRSRNESQGHSPQKRIYTLKA